MEIAKNLRIGSHILIKNYNFFKSIIETGNVAVNVNHIEY